jgi:Tol biopolymer transport system component
LTDGSVSDISPTWSPDGSTLAFVSGPDGARDLYVMGSDGRGVSRLTVGAGVTRDMPVWSPDGARIAFQMARGENYDVGVVRLSDRKQSTLAGSSAYDGLYAWSPDGRRIAFISARDGFESLYIADAEGANSVRVTTTPSLNPAWRR